MLKFRTLKFSVLLHIALIQGCSSAPKSMPDLAADEQRSPIAIQQTSEVAEVVARLPSAEKQVLIRLVREIEELDALIEEAQFKADPGSRLKFDYLQLRNDLLLITHGIHSHIRISEFTPRTLKPVVGEYGR